MTADRTRGAAALWGRDALERLAAAALDGAGRDDVEVVVQRSAGGLTRFANSSVHQNVAMEDVLCNVRVVTSDARVGVAGVHTDDPGIVAKALERARAAARLCPPDPEFPGLAGAAGYAPSPFDEATITATPGDRAGAVRAVLTEVPASMEAAGAYETYGAEVLVRTTTGQAAYSPASTAHLVLVVSASRSSGFAEAGGRSITDIDPARAGRIAVEKAEAGADQVDLPTGVWPVVLEPPAVAALVEYLAYLGFGGKDYLEGRSFACDRLGERVLDPKLTIVDDARSPVTTGLPFDHEGTPKERVELVLDGVLNRIVHDRYTAARAQTRSTGHGFLAPNPHGPIATNPLLSPGDGGSINDLVAGMERGLLVTRFHYVNVVHPLETTLTGMTRDGTFLVEDGKVTRAVHNLRFTQSVVQALTEVHAVSTETGYGSELFFGGRSPSVRLPAFSFTGTTTFG